MALPTLAEFKAVLRVQTTAEDTALTSMLASARAAVEAYLDNPIVSRQIVAVDEGVCNRATHMLIFPHYPVAADTVQTPITIEDADGVAVAADFWRINLSNGLIRARNRQRFVNFPYTITATAGWDRATDYATLVEPVLRQAILDLGAEIYAARNPGASSESGGSGVMASFGLRPIPPRVERMLVPFRRRAIA